MLNRFAHFAQRIYNVPLMIHPQKAEMIAAAIADRLGIAQIIGANGKVLMMEDAGDWSPGKPHESDCGYDMHHGVAVIPVHGTLVHKNGTMRPFSGMTGYDGIRQSFMNAISDASVKAIVMDIDSPGGEVSGCFDLVDMIYEARGTKKIHAILSEHAYSAAYAIASACDRIIMPRTGGVGSIGVIAAHVDYSQALNNAGVVVTFIEFGKYKSDGAGEKPLSKDARARFQAQIDKTGELFVDTVARNRNLDPEVIRGTEAACFSGTDGVDLRLADVIQSPDAAFRELLTSI